MTLPAASRLPATVRPHADVGRAWTLNRDPLRGRHPLPLLRRTGEELVSLHPGCSRDSGASPGHRSWWCRVPLLGRAAPGRTCGCPAVGFCRRCPARLHRPPSEKERDDRPVSPRRCLVEWCPASAVTRVHICARIKQGGDLVGGRRCHPGFVQKSRFGVPLLPVAGPAHVCLGCRAHCRRPIAPTRGLSSRIRIRRSLRGSCRGTR